MERIDESPLTASRLWRNPPVRRLAAILLAALVAAAVLIGLFSNYASERLERDWYDRQAAVIGTLASAHPELADELPKLIAESGADPEAVALGRELADRHGAGERLAGELPPAVSAFRSRTATELAFGALLLLAALGFALLREQRLQLGSLRALALSLESAVKQNRPMRFRLYGEGELGLLAHSVQELALRLQMTIGQLKGEKAFLKETIADISHQLKTPLASLSIYVDLLRQERTRPDEAETFLSTCRQELDRMEWLTLTMLKIARLEADALELRPEAKDLAGTVEDAVEPLREWARRRQVNLKLEAPAEQAVVPHDSRWLAEAIANVVRNAVEHSPAGCDVTVRWQRTPALVRLEVLDEGPGIEEKHLPHLFKKFYRTSSGGSGVGLGLPLAKSIAERHEGLLSARNRPEGGAAFTLTLPVRRPQIGLSGTEPGGGGKPPGA
ncbi:MULTISPECIES: sensor histidine kinase [Cohnella]|uniref:sensor histidine kinase n=1 Tax=Cohnella TaxID=329857 RepID=UPI0009BBBC03|nr:MULTISPECIES: HAMP domain-containing sensor histidine kinase [Cohnella]MBN2981304.1 HAMP domain-containing histidine kinase [Cohnella algarum]